MAVFKYFRPGVYLENATRYNELYFSANHELNDPNDLMSMYYFEDEAELWSRLLQRPQKDDAWNMSHHVDTNCEKLASNLAEVFRGVKFDSSMSIRDVVKSKETELAEVFTSALWDGGSKESSFAFSKDYTPEVRAELCILALTDLLGGGHNLTFYSVSFSKRALEPMMWAHYADGFKGCVLIYNDHGGSLDLKPHPLSPQTSRNPLLPVSYVDSEKRIPILKSAIDGVGAKIFAHIQKNSFWHYEEEVRLLITKMVDTRLQAMLEKIPESPVQRVFHHDYRDILGVIFGPKCDVGYKEKIKSILRHNRLHAGKESFVSLNTRFTREGNVEITDGDHCICLSPAGGWSPVQGDALIDLLRGLGVH